VQKENGMNRLHSAPHLRRLPFLRARHQRLVAKYLAFLTVRHYAPKTTQNTVGLLKTFCVLPPAARQSRVYRDFTQVTPDDIDAWLEAAHHHGLAPSTLNNILNALHRFCAFLQEQGYLARLPINRRRHQVLVPHTLNAGAPLEVVKELMGHRSIGMTLRYTQLYEPTKRAQYYQAVERIEPRQALFDR
jgi:site-specific recombinase XerD